ncbi:hypothetical protein VOLCADRAFT_84647 [Volvox carteri f. nagariensis]|uniref:Peptidase M60 domain-containing protein n=1 Tax=Volvox carteri f. nagariensis TaxID=3068 RepID=D8UJF4_VOLCA|nr:uncharacterized protein VOLCADRAFT_84647 [Volvox carteri f. nagariensis]EFJ40132.1 hypothetical protein VOLCADRAFT_84647 [Volvox carteri f. nagariensis]|eukprot:XP_002958789.1 hypothetical protein VOLCADRAFT_84647 [Volvox carteri f. nagariensis]
MHTYAHTYIHTCNQQVATDAWTVRRGEISGIRPSLSAAVFPGVPSGNPPSVNVSYTINGTYNRPGYHFGYADWDSPVWQSTGLYALPGQAITVTLSTLSAVGRGLQVQIGAHTDDLTGKTTWYRVPHIVNRFDLNTTVTSAANPLGGPVFILVPVGATLGSVQITIGGAIRAPYFRLNVTQLNDWNSTIRNYPAPWAELDSGKLVLMLPSRAIRNITNPVPLLEHWNLVMDHMANLANITSARAREERFLVDADISAGWMHSGYPVMAADMYVCMYIHVWMHVQAQGAWGPYHELGHNHQWSEMQFSGTTESFVNLFTVYVLEMTGVPQTAWGNWDNVSPTGRAALRAKYFADGANWARDWDVWVALDTYLQLKEGFGWNFYRRLYTAYQQMPLPLPADNVQTWIQTSSKMAGVNLVPFYQKWNFTVTQDTINAVASLPTWTSNPFNAQG